MKVYLNIMEVVIIIMIYVVKLHQNLEQIYLYQIEENIF